MKILKKIYGKSDVKIDANEIALVKGVLIGDFLMNIKGASYKPASESYYTYKEGLTVHHTSTQTPGHGYPSGDYSLIVTFRTMETRVWQLAISHDNNIWSRTGKSDGSWNTFKKITMT